MSTTTFETVDPDELRRQGSVRWTFHDRDVLPLSFAEMDFDIAPPIAEGLCRAVRDGRVGNTRAGRGAQAELADAYAAFVATRHDWRIDPSDVRTVAGVLKGIELAIEAYTAPGSGVVLPTPAYQQFFGVLRLVDRPIHFAPMVVRDGRYELDLDAIDRGLAEGCGSVLLCNPHNPTGRSFEHAELEALAQVVEARGARVIVDEVHAPLTMPGHRHVHYASVSDAAAGHSITLAGATKGWNLAGFPCGQVVLTNDEARRTWAALPPLATHGVANLAVQASTIAFRDGLEWLDAVRSHLARSADLVRSGVPEALPGTIVRPIEATYMAWVDCSALELDDPSDWLERHARVSSFPGRLFSPDHRSWLRLCFPTSHGVLGEAIERMRRAWEAR